ncbi:Ras guanine nucleotide exchange factor glfB-like C-terminal domain-containing protein [Entamoeba marina]
MSDGNSNVDVKDSTQKKEKKKGLFDLFSRIKHTSVKAEKKDKKSHKRSESQMNKSQVEPEKPVVADPKKDGYTQNTMVNLLKNLPDWRESTRKVIVSGNFETFPIAGDLPRLLKHLSIVKKVSDEEYDRLFPEEGKVNGKVKVIKDVPGHKITTGDCLKVILCITKILDESKCDTIEKEWNEVMDNSEDLSVQKTFLMRLLKSVFMNESSQDVSAVITFLKAINQKIIASSTMNLKGVCGNLFIKDAQPMVWEIAVILEENRTIISHYRRQETTSKNSTDYFRFLWELRLIFNKELTQLQELKMGITDIEFISETSERVRENVTSTLDSLMFPDCNISDLDSSDDEE